MRKVKAVAIAVLTVLAAMIVARTAAGDDSIQAIEPQQIATADWQQVEPEPAQQIIETREPEVRVEEITEPAYIPSTEAAEGCISEAELIAHLVGAGQGAGGAVPGEGDGGLVGDALVEDNVADGAADVHLVGIRGQLEVFVVLVAGAERGGHGAEGQ